ncbi:MAG: YajQ family cyclic di-GMP-binding protein [bacterium]
MASDNSFDIVSKIDLQEVDNAVNQAMKEISTRYDFRGSISSITRDKNTITILADDDYKLKSVIDLFQNKLVKRGIPLQGLQFKAVETASGGSSRQVIDLQQGIPTEKAKEIVKLIKGMKIKVQASIQSDSVRVTGKSRDDLQSVIAMLKTADLKISMQFSNYR